MNIQEQSYSNSSVNMYPSTNVFGSYLVELITHFGWSNVGIINELQLINEVSQNTYGNLQHVPKFSFCVNE